MESLGPYELNNIYCGDSAYTLAELPDDCIDLTLTSPPYDNLRDYNGYTFEFPEIARQLYRVTKEGGVVVWVVGDATINGSETGTSFRQSLYFMECGFKLHDTMIYQKRGSPFPDKTRYYQVFEYMFILSKGPPLTTNLIQEKTIHKPGAPRMRQKNGELKRAKYQLGKPMKNLENVWRYNVGNGKSTLDKMVFAHPGTFPEALARDHILSWSNPGDIVLDPFMGSGTTAKMAIETGRRFLGFDISQEYVDLAKERVKRAKIPFKELL